MLLQAPMEPFDYPDNDPGPQTLLTTLQHGAEPRPPALADEPLPGLRRHRQLHGRALHRRPKQALAPVLKETARRGLIYVDDGSSPRSVAGQIAGANNLPFAKAEVDARRGADARRISTSALARLEALAREHGSAVGIASALPASIERIAQWAKAAEGRGIVLVPITAVAIKPKSS